MIKGEVEKNDYLETEGSFTAKLFDVNEKEGQFSPLVQFTFEVLNDPDNEGKKVTGITSKKVTPDNKTSTWIKALDSSFELEIGATFTFDSLVGKVCRILVEEKEGKTQTYCNVVKCRALKAEELSALKKATQTAEPKKEEKKEEKPKVKPKAVDDDIDF